MKELDELRAAFLSPEIDSETRVENEEKIREWEQGLVMNEAFAGWQSHDVTRQIVAQAKQSYKEMALLLAENRHLKEGERLSLWAKQDAIVWLLSLTERDAKGALDNIRDEIRTALNAL